MAIPYNDLTALRREIHANPELSRHEKVTRRRVKDFLTKQGITHFEDMGETGMRVVFDSGTPGPTIMIRGDMDALPIQEINDDLEYKSTVDGVSHKCGHDGHTTIITGLCISLHQQPLQKGKVVVLYQPAEEIGYGANSILKDEKFNEHVPDWAFALHNLPGYPMHEVVYRQGIFTPAVKKRY